MYDAVLLLSFGGPEGPDEVLPFLENVTRGRGVPAERLAEVAAHYHHVGGVSPLNAQNRALIELMRADFAAHGLTLPIYWGNRNWHPYVTDTVRQMTQDGVARAVAVATSAFASYSACRQYLDDIAAARREVGPHAPHIDKVRHFYDHPGFVEPHADAVRAALATLGEATPATTRLVFTAHSIPTAMDTTSGPVGGLYSAQVAETARLVAAAAAPALPYDVVWQSRSGSPRVPWLAPDINDRLLQLADEGITAVVVSPIGFVSDHMEVRWDLDHEAADTAKRLGLRFARAATPGTDSRFVVMLRDLVTERITGHVPAIAPPTCGMTCCPAPSRSPDRA